MLLIESLFVPLARVDKPGLDAALLLQSCAPRAGGFWGAGAGTPGMQARLSTAARAGEGAQPGPAGLSITGAPAGRGSRRRGDEPPATLPGSRRPARPRDNPSTL